MLSWIIILSAASYAYCQVKKLEYECGAHGRFEYCIDGTLECVIGCHCHPGYYFDTDTKICEPNTKLTKNYRRQYDYPEPTRIQIPPLHVTPPIPEDPATTARNAVDEKIDIIAKDADDLGDWLYNQFFKTIENQLINETKDDDILTRRSGNIPNEFNKKPSRRSNKYWKARKRKKRRKHRMKSKLLRITEDDSLFDDSDDSDSTSDDDSDASSSSESEETDNDSESKDHEKNHDKDRGHKHGKEVVVYNKRPKPPLPSFIFLPNMDTPFFPPLGLPPPAMPMYPMVPVPPMMGPYPHMPGHHTHEGENNDCDDNNKNHKESDKNTEAPHDKNKTTKKQEHETDSPIDPEMPDENVLDKPQENNQEMPELLDPEKPDENVPKQPDDNTLVKPADNVPEKPDENAPEKPVDNQPQSLRFSSKSRGRPRNQFMQRMREKLKRKNKLQNFFASEYQQPPQRSSDAECPTIPELNQHKTSPKCDLRTDLSKLQDVDFKYLSQLIHKADLNKTNNFSPAFKGSMTNLPINHPPVQSRRNYYDSNADDINQPPPNLYSADQVINNLNNIANESPNSPAYHIPNKPLPTFNNDYKYPYRNKIEATNDTYYAHLGRQIAAMIRNIDADKEVDIEIENTNKGVPILDRIRHGSSSYWDRAVRSPYKNMKTHKKKLKIKSLKMSNEDLYSLENRVEIAASTKPTLGLNELENIVSKMERAKLSLIKNKNFNDVVRATSSKTSFNVNLLPGNDHTYFSTGKNHKNPKYVSLNTSANRPNIEKSPLLFGPNKSFKTKHFKVFNVLPKPGKQINNTTTTKKTTPRPSVAVPSNKTNIFRPLRYKMANNNKYYTVMPQPFFPNIKFIKDTARKTHYHELNPMVLNRKSFNYYPENNNQYVHEKFTPARFRTLPHKLPKDTSYFHQQQYFDYFDDLF